jgi:hypothetical protein
MAYFFIHFSIDGFFREACISTSTLHSPHMGEDVLREVGPPVRVNVTYKDKGGVINDKNFEG